ncbi:hypothetical protein LWI29_021609 [Acer saccharum]|uniref:Uncharacterized protein n=1 Tax=Acer saccharum TaxID=4024 RepID=A0AA39S4L5_ACESA|nr:hypothetical protein LWI29_021609 [Acer saccharum]
MDPSLRSFLFNRMMQAMELGDKCTADKIESLIRNFRPDSPVPISVDIPFFENASNPDISPPPFDSDSPEMTRSPKTASGKRRSTRAPRESLLDVQTVIDSDVEDHQRDRLLFSSARPCSFDTEVNVVGEGELRKYKSRFDIPDSVTLVLPGDRAVWNPPENAVAIYGAMLSCGVTLPLQPFIARFLAEAQIAPAQLAPNSYGILMCLCLMWKLKGYGPPTPREIRHFYTLRQAGNGGTYFLLSSPVENWIPEGVANPGQVEVSSDEKKKGFIWGFPTSNKRWKNSWFFASGEWGRNVPAHNRHNLLARKVPRHFTSPEAWSKAAPVLTDREVSHLAAAAVLPLDSRGRSFLLDEEKMISSEIFTRLHARLPRLCDFDTVCDLQARAVKNSEAASKRHAAGLAKDGIASPDGDDHSDGGEEAGDASRGGAVNTPATTAAVTPSRKGKEKAGASRGVGSVDKRRVESGPPPVRPKVVASTPATASSPAVSTAATVPAATVLNRKGKEKVGVSGVASDIPIFDADVPETPLDPASDLAPRARNKRPAESAPDHSARPPKRASRVVQFVVSSDEEDVREPDVAEAPLAQPERSAEAENVAAPPSEGVNEQTPPAAPSQPASPRPASLAVVVGEQGVSDQPGPSGPSESTDRPGPSHQAGTSASGSGSAREVPPAGPVEAEEGSVSLFDFSATEICSHLTNNDVYIGESWGHVKNKSCNKKMEFFFNCHSLMMSEMGDSYKFGIKASREIKRLREQASVLAAEKLSAEESHAQQFAQLRESSDGHLSARLAAEEKLSAAEEEIRSLKELLSSSQESFAARLEAERVAEEAKEKAELEAADLRNQLSSRDLIFENLKAVLEVESVDRFKRSPAYDALLLREFEKGMRQAKKFFAMKDHSNEKALKRFDKSLQQHMAHGVDSIKDQMRRWKAHCRYNRTEPHPMHLEIPSKRTFNTYYSGQKGSFSGSGAEPDLGPVAGRDYEPFMPTEDEAVIWPSDEEIEDEEDSEGPPAAG